MGVPFRIVAYGTDEDAVRVAAQAAFVRIRELNAIFSDYDPESEVRRLCAAPPASWQSVSAELLEVFTLSRDVWQHSAGAFDPSLAPVVELWRRARRSAVLPNSDAIAEALAKRGMDRVQLDVARCRLRISPPALRLDFGAIAKGYAADEALCVLGEHGVQAALIDAGGDLALGAAPPEAAGWKIALEDPRQPEHSAAELCLANCAVATSGDTWQFLEIDGQRYAHIVDPQTGLGLTRRTSATVIAPRCALADALATTLCVLEPPRGFELIGHYEGVSACIATIRDDDFELEYSPTFGAHIVVDADRE